VNVLDSINDMCYAKKALSSNSDFLSPYPISLEKRLLITSPAVFLLEGGGASSRIMSGLV